MAPACPSRGRRTGRRDDRLRRGGARHVRLAPNRARCPPFRRRCPRDRLPQPRSPGAARPVPRAPRDGPAEPPPPPALGPDPRAGHRSRVAVVARWAGHAPDRSGPRPDAPGPGHPPMVARPLRLRRGRATRRSGADCRDRAPQAIAGRRPGGPRPRRGRPAGRGTRRQRLELRAGTRRRRTPARRASRGGRRRGHEEPPRLGRGPTRSGPRLQPDGLLRAVGHRRAPAAPVGQDQAGHGAGGRDPLHAGVGGMPGGRPGRRRRRHLRGFGLGRGAGGGRPRSSSASTPRSGRRSRRPWPRGGRASTPSS